MKIEIKKNKKKLCDVLDTNKSNKIKKNVISFREVNYLLNSYNNILSIYSSHFKYITKLGNKIENIGNKKVNVNRVNNKIVFPYKIESGISNDFIALELLKEKGFNNKFLNNAINVKEKLNSEFNF